MVRGLKNMQMEIYMKEIILMVFARALVLSDGEMEVFMMEISNKVIVMVMAFGNQINPLTKHIKVIICWIKSMAMAFMIGEMVIFIRGITFKIKEMDMVSYITKINLCTRANG